MASRHSATVARSTTQWCSSQHCRCLSGSSCAPTSSSPCGRYSYPGGSWSMRWSYYSFPPRKWRRGQLHMGSIISQTSQWCWDSSWSFCWPSLTLSCVWCFPWRSVDSCHYSAHALDDEWPLFCGGFSRSVWSSGPWWHDPAIGRGISTSCCGQCPSSSSRPRRLNWATLWCPWIWRRKFTTLELQFWWRRPARTTSLWTGTNVSPLFCTMDHLQWCSTRCTGISWNSQRLGHWLSLAPSSPCWPTSCRGSDHLATCWRCSSRKLLPTWPCRHCGSLPYDKFPESPTWRSSTTTPSMPTRTHTWIGAARFMCVGWSDWPLWHLSQQQLVGTSGLWSSRSTSWSLSTCSDSRTCSKILQDSSFAIFHNRLPDRWTPYQIQQGSNFIWCEPYDINARASNVSESHSDAQTKEPTCDSTQCDIPQLGLCTLRGCSTTFSQQDRETSLSTWMACSSPQTILWISDLWVWRWRSSGLLDYLVSSPPALSTEHGISHIATRSLCPTLATGLARSLGWSSRPPGRLPSFCGESWTSCWRSPSITGPSPDCAGKIWPNTSSAFRSFWSSCPPKTLAPCCLDACFCADNWCEWNSKSSTMVHKKTLRI